MRTEEVIIYYNEPDEKVYIKVRPGIETYYQLQNLSGKVLQEAHHTLPLHDFDLTGFPEGNYFVLVTQGEKLYSKKIRKEDH